MILPSIAVTWHSIRLIGPRPKWARADGGEGGAHPSNVVEYGYPLGALNWTGDDPCLFPVDCPDLGGFVSSTTITKSDFWKMGQMRAGDTVQFIRVSVDDAVAARQGVEAFVSDIIDAMNDSTSLDVIQPLINTVSPARTAGANDWGKAVIRATQATDDQPFVSYRQGGDDFLIVDYGFGAFDLNHPVPYHRPGHRLEKGRRQPQPSEVANQYNGLRQLPHESLRQPENIAARPPQAPLPSRSRPRRPTKHPDQDPSLPPAHHI